MKKIAFFAVTLSMVGTASAITINFDEFGVAPTVFNNANPLRNAYAGQGVFFTGPSPLAGGAVLDQASNFGVNALSGRNFLAFNRSDTGVTMLNGGRPFDPETITFSNFVNQVSIFASGGVFQGTFVMSAYGAGNTFLGASLVNTNAGQWGLVGVNTGANAIDHVTLTEVSGATFFVYDDLSAVPEPATMAVLGLGAAALLRRRRK